jgi:PKD repeat protein
MSTATCYNVPPDRDVVVLDHGDPAGVGTALLAAAQAAGLPANVVRRAVQYGGFYVPASIANIAPAPVLSALVPDTATLTDEDFEGHVHGTGFIDGAVIVWNGGDEPTRFVDETDLWTTVVPSAVTSPTTIEVYVRNPDGQRSNSLTFTWAAGEPQVLDAEFTTAIDGLTVTATDTSLPTEGATVTDHNYSFGGAGTPTGILSDPVAVWTYDAPGTYTISSTVRDSYGYTDTQTYDVTVA